MFSYLQEILTLLGNEKRYLPGLILLFIMVSILDLVGLSLVGPYVAFISDPSGSTENFEVIINWLGMLGNVEDQIFFLGIGLVVVFGIKAFSAIWINHRIILFSTNQRVRLQLFLMQSFQDMPYIEYIKRNSSEYVHSIDSLTNQFAVQVIQSSLRILSDAIVVTVIILVLLWVDPGALTLLLCLLSVLAIGYDRFFRERLVSYGVLVNKAARKVIKVVQEAMGGFKEVRIFGREVYFRDTLKKAANDFGYYQLRSTLISIMPRYYLEFFMIFFIVSLVSLTLIMGESLEELLPTLVIFGLASLRIFPAVNSISSSLVRLRYCRDAVSNLYSDVKKLEDILDSREIKPNIGNIDRFSSIELKNIWFQYSKNSQYALQDLSIKIEAGESIGIIGPSGSGKSTLIDLLLGLVQPQKGTILYNGKVMDGDYRQWQKQVAYIPQQIFLIDDTLARNVALGVKEDEIDQDMLNQALKQARLKKFVESLPNGKETILGERGICLSGGQRQRISLARAFYHERDVLVMDEATSALDSQTELEIASEILKLKKKKTLIIVAHRMSTVQNCDCIYKIDEGSIVSYGKPEVMLE
jgi:ABC-type multidrug transport system fused ATPase/permease subunit